ncbi:TraG/TraD/VirD4 family protein, partial [Clostridium perfringens]|nr:TraG/TraD/VirD4 family protein [Clostridium perfringens]
LSSIFIRQLYYVLAKEASLSETGKCEREVIFNLDEFGNMPAIEGFANIVTVCLGRKIRFNIVIQALSQLKKLYGEDDKTIIGNCGNLIYLLTNDNDTAEEVSKSLGDQTIVTESRSGETLDITKNRTESLDSERLLRASALLEFQEGEMVVKRVIKRQDLKGNRIVPYPIHNHGETAMKFRWEYLGESFDNEKAFRKVRIKSKHRNVNLDDLLINFDESEEDYIKRLHSLGNEEENIIENNDKQITKNIKLGDFLAKEDISSFSMSFAKYRKELAKFNLKKIDENTLFSEIEEIYTKSNIPVLQERLEFLRNKLEEKENEVVI